MDALRKLAEAPTTIGALRGLTATVEHAAAAAALPRPVRDGLQLLEHVLDVHGRALHGARPDRRLGARAAQPGRPTRTTASARRAPTSSPHGKQHARPTTAAPRSSCTTTSTATRDHAGRQRELHDRPAGLRLLRPTRPARRPRRTTRAPSVDQPVPGQADSARRFQHVRQQRPRRRPRTPTTCRPARRSPRGPAAAASTRPTPGQPEADRSR